MCLIPQVVARTKRFMSDAAWQPKVFLYLPYAIVEDMANKSCGVPAGRVGAKHIAASRSTGQRPKA